MAEKKKKGLVYLAMVTVCVGVLFAFLFTASTDSAQNGVARGGGESLGGASRVAMEGGAQSGDVGRGGEAQSVNLGALPQATQQSYSNMPVIRHYRPLDGLTDAQYAAKKAAARKGGIKGTPGNAAPAGGKSGIQSVGFSRGFFAQQEVCCTPPDHALAVGENFVVQFINTYIAVYDKNGNLQSGFPKDADTFFGLAGGTYTTDPRGFYDWSNHRFVFIMLTESSPSTGTNTGALMVAASQTEDPRGGWWVYSDTVSFPSGECPDYPTLGHDSNNWGTYATKGGFYVGINEFGGSGHCNGAGFIQNYVYFFPKDAFYSGSGYSYWYEYGFSVNSTLVDTLQPANMTDRSDHPDAIYLVNSYNMLFGDPSNGLAVWSVSGPTSGSVIAPNNPFAFLQGGNGPVFTLATVGTSHNYTFPPNADEPNGSGGVCSGCIDTGDKRISGSVKYHAGELFGSMNTGVANGTAGPIWFEIHPVSSNTNSTISSVDERQEDCFVCGGWAKNGSAYYATLQPDQENNLVMVFEYSTDTVYPSVVYTSRRVSYGDNLMNGVGNYLAGGSAYYSQGRWGDYTATAPDLTIANFPTMWFAGMYANGSGNWGTAIGEARYHYPSDQ
ncbi:MAG TPA: hypothetical protein VG028_17320 [Terriglobia bacterium]|nr:hypothetical protein [Terriglobia bacterium]